MKNKIKILILDVDGVLTDGRIFYNEKGEEAIKTFDVKDGFAIKLLYGAGIPVAVISGKKNKIIEKRAYILSISDVYTGFMDKLKAYAQIKKKYGFKDSEAAYMGDDLFDLPLIKKVGFSACPADAAQGVKKSVKYPCKNQGGRGAVREVIEKLFPEVMKNWKKYL